MNNPKVLIFMQAHNVHPEDEGNYFGVLALSAGTIEILKEHLSAMVALQRYIPKAMTRVGDALDFRYRTVMTDHGTSDLHFLDRGATHLFEENTNLNIDDLLDAGIPLVGGANPFTALEEDHLLVVDMGEWCAALKQKEICNKTPEELWEAIHRMCEPIRCENILLQMPVGASASGALEGMVTFAFSARHKHADGDADWQTSFFNLQGFLQGIGDLVLSRSKA